MTKRHCQLGYTTSVDLPCLTQIARKTKILFLNPRTKYLNFDTAHVKRGTLTSKSALAQPKTLSISLHSFDLHRSCLFRPLHRTPFSSQSSLAIGLGIMNFITRMKTTY